MTTRADMQQSDRHACSSSHETELGQSLWNWQAAGYSYIEATAWGPWRSTRCIPAVTALATPFR